MVLLPFTGEAQSLGEVTQQMMSVRLQSPFQLNWAFQLSQNFQPIAPLQLGPGHSLWCGAVLNMAGHLAVSLASTH